MTAARSTQTADQRKSDRRDVDGNVRVHVVAADVVGGVRNLSEGGVMLTVHDSLRVTVEVEVDGVVHTRTGRLARIQRMSGDEHAMAIEFDDEADQPSSSPK